MDAELYTAPPGGDVVRPLAQQPGGLRREVAYDRLKTGLLIGDYPLNRRLGEERLAAQLGVSRTPVREAPLRLDAEGLVQRSPEGTPPSGRASP